MPLARDEVRDRRDQRLVAARRERRQIGTEVEDARPRCTVIACLQLGTGAIGEHEPSRGEGAPHDVGSAGSPRSRPEHVAAVDRNNQWQVDPRSQRRIARRDRVMGVNELESARCPDRARQPGGRPPPPLGIAPGSRWRQVADVVDRQAIALGISGLARCCVAASGEAMQDEYDDLDALFAGCQRLAVCPDAEHRV